MVGPDPGRSGWTRNEEHHRHGTAAAGLKRAEAGARRAGPEPRADTAVAEPCRGAKNRPGSSLTQPQNSRFVAFITRRRTQEAHRPASKTPDVRIRGGNRSGWRFCEAEVVVGFLASEQLTSSTARRSGELVQALPEKSTEGGFVCWHPLDRRLELQSFPLRPQVRDHLCSNILTLCTAESSLFGNSCVFLRCHSRG
jgi:hypothetical protein